MTLHSLWEKLRKKSRRDYRQFQFSTAFASLLISSFLILVCSPLLQSALPDGGDSAKQIWLSFAISAIGCIIFVLYVTKLFLRFKSREIGIFLALGADRPLLQRTLSAELAKMTAVCSAAGILAGAALACFIGKIIELFVSHVYTEKFSFTLKGILFSICFSAVLFLFIQFQASQVLKGTNIIDVIYEEHRQEPMKKSVSKAYFISGVFLTLAGIFCALVLPQIITHATGIFLGGWTNLFYLATVFGIYRMLVYAVSSHQRDRNPQKYYNNLIDFGMMKFQGASVVRNMLVITLLLFGGLYAISYVPMMLSTSSAEIGYEADFSFRYLNDADEPSESELKALAKKYHVSMKNYREGSFLHIPGSGTERDADEKNQLVENYYENFANYDVTSVSQFKTLTGISLDIPAGFYYQIIGGASYENLWFQFGDMDQLYIEDEAAYLPLKYTGTVRYESLNIGANNNMGDGARFVVSDSDFARLKNGLGLSRLETQVLFDVEGSTADTICFSNELFRIIAEGMSANMDVLEYYNESTAARGGTDYTKDYTGAVVDPENPLKATDWQFAPLFVPLLDQQLLMELSTRLLMFSYIFVICIAATGVIGYTRSQSVGLTNRQVFEDIRQLGAALDYRQDLIQKQIRKIFVLPTLLGTGLCLIYQLVLRWNNDRILSTGEIRSMLIVSGVALAIGIFQYIVYRLSVKKTMQLLNLL